MKSLLTILLIGNLLGIVTLGFVDMHSGMQVHGGGCVAATAQGMDCPKEGNLRDYLAFHLDAFKKFSTATLSENFLNVLLLVLATSLLICCRIFLLFRFESSRLILSSRKPRETFAPPQKHALIYWLALHENSPATF